MKNKRIVIKLFNWFTEEEYLSINAPYDRLKAMNNWYSKWVSKNKNISADIYGVEKRFIKTKVTLL